MKKRGERDIILVVGFVSSAVLASLKQFQKDEQKKGKKYRLAIIHDKKANKLTDEDKEKLGRFDLVLNADFDDPLSLEEVLTPYREQIAGAVSRGEPNVVRLRKVIPYIPYTKSPSTESLQWSLDKLSMRRRFRRYNPQITPRFSVVADSTIKTIKELETKIGYPMVLKPANLTASMLVTINYHREELEKNLKSIFRRINKVYREKDRAADPEVLVEEFLEGGMYSVDAYVNSKGKVYFCPPVYVKTGRSIGFDDFFGYRQMTPTKLKKESIEAAEVVATDAIHALGLRSCTAHIELMRTEDGWKVIELGPRVGGFRDDLYKLSFGINHTTNDVLIRLGRKPHIPKKIKGYSVAMKFYAKKEGTLRSLQGIKKAEKLKSFYSIAVNKKLGDRVTYAKHGGKSVFNIILFNKDRSLLLADIRRLEEMIRIEV